MLYQLSYSRVGPMLAERDARMHDARMRTTLTLEEDIARELRAQMRRSGRSLEQLVNEALRRDLRAGEKPQRGSTPFVVKPFSSPYQRGVDGSRLNQLMDELEIEDFAAKVTSKSPV